MAKSRGSWFAVESQLVSLESAKIVGEIRAPLSLPRRKRTSTKREIRRRADLHLNQMLMLLLLMLLLIGYRSPSA